MKQKFADIHVHSTLKPYAYMKYPEDGEKTIWDRFEERKKDLKKLCFLITKGAKELAKSSQANFDSCVDANFICLFLSLYPVERQWFDVKPKKFKWRLILPKWKYKNLGAALSGFPTEYVNKIIGRIENNEGIDYFNEELLPLVDYTLNQRNSKSKKYPYYTYKIASDYKEFKILTNEDKTICGIITIEGGNSLCSYSHHDIFYKEFEDLNSDEILNLRTHVTNNVEILKSLNGGRSAPFFISFCHHYNNLLAGHSKSLGKFGELLDQKPGLNKGFNELGKEVLDLLLSRKRGRRILIDTKHMSILSRRYYHELVKERRLHHDFIPIVQSHAAISGCRTFSEALGFDEDRKGNDEDTYFSNWKVNINDEEILDIYDSDGIIGIVFHEDRMPGGRIKAQIKNLSNRYHKFEKKQYLSARQQTEYSEVKEKLKLIYVELIWSNIFHIIKLVYDNRDQKNGWKIISIGSDYDGMIDPFDGYFSVTDLPALFNDMAEYLNKGRGPIYFAEDGSIREFQSYEIQRLMFGKSAEGILEDICFNNVDSFLSKYFTDRYLSKKRLLLKCPKGIFFKNSI